MRHLLLVPVLLLIAPTTNPVDLYQQAFVLLDDAREGQRSELNDIDKTPLNETTAGFLKEREPVIKLLREAAKLPAAQWPTPEADLAPVFPSLNKARHSANLLLLQARMDLHNKKAADAVEHNLAAIAMARNIGQQKLLVVHLVEIGIELKAIDQALAMLPKLPPDVVKTMPAKLAALPKPITAAEMIDAEFAYGEEAVVKQDVPPEFFEAAKPFYDAAARATTQPAEDFEATIDAEAAKLMLNPFVKNMAPTLKRAMVPHRKLQQKRQELLDACTTAAGGVSKSP